MKNSEQGVQPPNTPVNTGAPELDRLDWDDLRLFLDVTSRGSLRAAAEARRLSVNTVRARVERLEAAYGAPLLTRTREGSSVTAAGARLLRIARGMRQGAEGAAARPLPGHVRDAVRLATTEGLGVLWLMPRLGAVTDRLGPAGLEVQFSYDFRGLPVDGIDVAIAFQPPEEPGYDAVRIATLHYMMFAAPAYVAAHGCPIGLHEVARRRRVEQSAPGLHTHILDYILGPPQSGSPPPIRTNSSAGQLAAVEAGAGIAAMPTYVAVLSPDLVAIEPPLNLRFDVYAVFSAASGDGAGVRTLLDWLSHCTDPEANPWFRHEFVHPRDFPRPQASSSTSQ
ncbi:MAG: LysR family transcriptional regulator [Alphaproteobacteria bacterium]|nr:LysR family transcriptional regulator [Alphaproteobacteria bacterium]